MKTYNRSFAYLPCENWELIELPDDLVHHPNYNPDYPELSLNKSDSTGKWYVLQELSDYTFPGLVDSGTWAECISYFKPNHIDAPFKFGIPYPSKHSDKITFTPIWQSVATGKYDFYGKEIFHEIYKIIAFNCSGNILQPEDENPYQFNNHTCFDVYEYNQDLSQLVSELELFTGLKF